MIGVFDSGVGGLSAFLPLRSLLPSADLLYYADTAALPLGEKSDGEILARVRRALGFFERMGVSGVLLACGTASSLFTEKCKEEFPFPIIDIISPTAMAAKSLAKNARILLLATPAAVRSGVFATAVAGRGRTVFSLACPHFVRLAEKGAPHDLSVLQKTLAPAIPLAPTAVLLGCTHFSLLHEDISTILPGTRLIDAAACGAAACAARLSEMGRGEERFFVTGDPRLFERRASATLHREIEALKITT